MSFPNLFISIFIFTTVTVTVLEAGSPTPSDPEPASNIATTKKILVPIYNHNFCGNEYKKCTKIREAKLVIVKSSSNQRTAVLWEFS